MQREPWSDIGALQNEVRDLTYKISQCAQSHEINQTNRYVDSLEHQVREDSSTLDGVRSELQTLQEVVKMIADKLEIDYIY